MVIPCLAAALSASPSPAVASISSRTSKGWIHAVQADLSSGQVEARIFLSPRLASPQRILEEQKPLAAMTGSFFAWENQRPVAEVLIEGQLAAQGRRGSILAFRWTGEPEIKDAPFGSVFDWSPYRWGLRGGIRLIASGVVCPNPQAQRFRDPALWGRAPRTAAGVTKAGKLVLAATAKSMTLSQFGQGVRSLGVVDAIALDGGGSTMLYREGQMVIPTKRPLSTLVTLHPAEPGIQATPAPGL